MVSLKAAFILRVRALDIDTLSGNYVEFVAFPYNIIFGVNDNFESICPAPN